MMSGEFLLERGERTVQIVGGVGDMKLRILLIGEQVRQVSLERAVCRVHTFVRMIRGRLAGEEGARGLLVNE